MKIAWFSHRYYPCVGGSENYGRAMTRRFVSHGHQADVFTTDALDLWYFTDPAKPRVDSPEVSELDGARVRRFRVKHWFGQRHVGRLLSYLPHFPTQCRFESFMPILPGIESVRGPYDAVFAIGFPYTQFSLAAWKTAEAAGAPLILTPFLHLATPGDPVNKTYTRPHQIRLLKMADTVVVQTQIEADAVAGWGINRAKILLLGMAVEHKEVTGGDPRMLREKLNISQSAQVVGHLATLDTNKGTTDLVLAFQQLNHPRIENPTHLILAGASSPAFAEFSKNLPADTHRWLHNLGPLPSERRAEFFAALNVFSMPSRTDSYGIVFLEAWANGLPVVAADAGGVAEVVQHGKNGLLVPFGNPSQLAQSIQQLTDNPSYAHQLGKAGHEKIARGHSWDDRFATLQGRVQELIPQSRRVLGQAG